MTERHGSDSEESPGDLDNGIMLAIPGAMHSGLSSPLFWGALTVALGVAFVVTVPVNRALIRRGNGHAVVHQLH